MNKFDAHILVVDDDDGIRELVKKYLSENPFDELLPRKEDRNWAKRVINKGKSFLYDPEMEADHHFTEKGHTWKDYAEKK